MTDLQFRTLVQSDISALVRIGERSVNDAVVTDRNGRQHRMRDLLPKPYSDAEIMRRVPTMGVLRSEVPRLKLNALCLLSSAHEARQLSEDEPYRRAFWTWRWWQDFSRACEQTRMALHQHVQRKRESTEAALRG